MAGKEGKRARRIRFRWIYVNRIKKLKWQYDDGESWDQKNCKTGALAFEKLKVERLGE